MAKYKGKDGVVNVGANAVANMRSWQYEESAETLDQTVMGDAARDFDVTFTGWTGSADVLYDDTDTSGQGALTVGSSVSVTFRPDGTGTGKPEATGTALVTGHSVNGSHDGLVEASISLQGTGSLTKQTQA